MNQPTYPKMKLFNPLKDDFSVTYDINGDGNPPVFTLHAGEIEEFSKPVAEHIAKHLAYEVVHKRQWKTNFEADYQRAMRLIQGEDDESYL